MTNNIDTLVNEWDELNREFQDLEVRFEIADLKLRRLCYNLRFNFRTATGSI